MSITALLSEGPQGFPSCSFLFSSEGMWVSTRVCSRSTHVHKQEGFMLNPFSSCS